MVNRIENVVNDLLKNTESILNRGLENQYINLSLKILLGLYAALVAPKLSPVLADLIDNTLVRILFAFVIVFMATRDPGLALLISVAFIISLQTANRLRLYNTSLSKSLPNQTSWLPSAKNIDQEHNVNNELTDEPSQNLSVVENLEGANILDTLEGSPLDTDFTSSDQFNNAQSNEVDGVDQDSCIKTFENQHCIQGLEQNSPNGI